MEDNNLMDVRVGTRSTEEFTINLNDYATRSKIDESLDEEEINEARDLLLDVLTSGKYFAYTGFRNDQAVNACIGLHMLGFDPVEWFNGFFNSHGDLFDSIDMDLFMEHVERVADYVGNWGPKGDMGRALRYTLH